MAGISMISEHTPEGAWFDDEPLYRETTRYVLSHEDTSALILFPITVGCLALAFVSFVLAQLRSSARWLGVSGHLTGHSRLTKGSG